VVYSGKLAGAVSGMAVQENLRLPVLYRLRLRASNCYLLIGDGVILID